VDTAELKLKKALGKGDHPFEGMNNPFFRSYLYPALSYFALVI